MPELSVVTIAVDSEQRAVLQVLVDGTSVARTVHAASSYPSAATDPLIARLHTLNPDVILVDVPVENASAALLAIEVLRQELPEVAVFAVGSMSQPQVIVSAMRAGAREFVERPTTTSDLLEAFVRLSTSQRKVKREGPRGKVFTVVNAKGGSGATTVAVNLALALQSAYGNVTLVDLAPLGSRLATRDIPRGEAERWGAWRVPSAVRRTPSSTCAAPSATHRSRRPQLQRRCLCWRART